MKQIISLTCPLQHRAPALLWQSCHECKGLWHGGEIPAKSNVELSHFTGSKRCPGWRTLAFGKGLGTDGCGHGPVPAADGRQAGRCGPGAVSVSLSARWHCCRGHRALPGAQAALPRRHSALPRGRCHLRGAGAPAVPCAAKPLRPCSPSAEHPSPFTRF